MPCAVKIVLAISIIWKVKFDFDLDILHLFHDWRVRTQIHIPQSHIQAPSHSLSRSRIHSLSRTHRIHRSTSHPAAPLQNNKGHLQKC